MGGLLREFVPYSWHHQENEARRHHYPGNITTLRQLVDECSCEVKTPVFVHGVGAEGETHTSYQIFRSSVNGSPPVIPVPLYGTLTM